MSAIPFSEQECCRNFQRALWLLREKGKFQVLCRFKRSRRGHLLLHVWRLPTTLQLTASVAEGVAKLLKPARIFSELDVFGVEENRYSEDDLELEDVAELVPNHVFDTESFYECV